MGIVAPTPILNLPVATGVDNTYWIPTASTNGSPTERVNVATLNGLQGSLDLISKTQGAVLYRGATLWEALDPGTSGYVLSTQGPNDDPQWVPNTAGSVTSVGLSLPISLFSVSGSPVTSFGTLTGTLIAQNANKVFAGPSTGPDATPTFRSLVNADITGAGASLTKTDDTNVTLTLGGSASTSLVNPASLTLGWAGQLSVTRGGTGLGAATAHNLLIGNGTSALTLLAPGSSNQVLTSNGASLDPSWQTASTAFGQALTKVDDTNVTLTLGGTPTSAVLSATSITAGWTGLLGLSRGGTNANLSATGGTSQVLRQSSTGAAITVSQLSASDIANGQALTRTNDTNVTLTLGGTPASSLLAATSLTVGWAGTLAVPRGGLGVGTLTAHGVLLGQGTSAVTATSVGATGSLLAGNTGADPTFQTVSAVLDNISSTQGTILYRGASSWSALGPGTNGQVLATGGPSANPSWIAAGGTGTVTSVAVSGGTTGLTTSGGPITTNGTITLAGTLGVANGGTGLTSGTSGGILGFTASGTLASSVALTANALVRGGGAGATPVPARVTEDGSGNLNACGSLNTDAFAGFRNRLINSTGQVAQAALGSTSDAGYCFDQWYVLTQSNPVTASSVTNAENGTPYMMRLTQANASAQRFGLAQPLENAYCADLRGKTVTLSARVQCSASTTLRYAIVESSATADTITLDIVNNWTSTTYTPGNFFISTNTTITATGSVALTANTLTNITALTGTVSSSMNNLIVFFWTDSAQAQNVTLDIGKVQLEVGSYATPYEYHRYDQEFESCLRYYWQINVSGGATAFATGFCFTTTNALAVLVPGVPFRVKPTLAISSVSDFAVYASNGGNVTATALTLNSSSTAGVVRFDITVASGLGQGNGTLLVKNAVGAAISLSARL